MTEFFNNLWYEIFSWDWLGISQTVLAAFTLFVAYSALHTWQRQLKTKVRIDFLDDLLDSAHSYIDLVHAPITTLQLAKIGIESHKNLPTNDASLPNPEYPAFIDSNGKYYSERILQHLDQAKPFVSRIRSLASKGQVLGFKDYEKCSKACKMLLWQYDRLQSFAAFIGSENMYWPNTRIQETAKKVMALDPDDIGKHLQDYNVSLLEFARDSYALLLGDT